MGAAVGLAGTFFQARLYATSSFGPSEQRLAQASWALQALGRTLTQLSLVGVPALLGAVHTPVYRRWSLTRLASVAVGVLLLLSIAAQAAVFLYLRHLDAAANAPGPGWPPPLVQALFWASTLLPPAVVVPFALVSLVHRAWRTAALLFGLIVASSPLGLLLWSLSPSTPQDMTVPLLLGLAGGGPGLPEVMLWALLGVMLFRAAAGRAWGETERLQAEENRDKALFFYEEGLGKGDGSAVDAVVSEDFRDRGSGARGRLGMERVIGDLWASYPDLSVVVEGQEAERDLVRTRLTISGTDCGSGVMWYPPTGRHVSFGAEFVDRFRGGVLIEHAGRANTEELLRQLGHHREG